GATPARHPGAPAAPLPWAVVIDAFRRVAVNADLAAGAPAHELAASPARRVDGEESAAPRVSLEPADAASGRPATLRVEVAEDVPAAIYRSAVVARASGHPCGEIEVQVFAGADPAAAGPDVA
ncbi:MAG TPA: hypothetical protein VMV46_21360, partial [Thermoanaerobaculia bacterium]|nr:hypothetical protein [Thermoanaerobaculia bacterium]